MVESYNDGLLKKLSNVYFRYGKSEKFYSIVSLHKRPAKYILTKFNINWYVFYVVNMYIKTYYKQNVNKTPLFSFQ
jgi:hypothetical protein